MKKREEERNKKPEYPEEKGALKTESDLKEFKRYSKIGTSDNWAISLTKEDAIIYEATRDVYIYGVGIYGAGDGKKHDFKVKYKWIIQKTANGDKIEESSAYYEESSSTPEPSQMKENKYF